MNEIQKPNTVFQEGHPAPPFTRLVVLVPDADLDDIRLARRLRTLMTPYKKGILLLTPIRETDQESLERRRLTNLAAILHDPHYSVSTQTLESSRWIDQINPILIPGDLLVCLAGQSSPLRGLKKQTIVEALIPRVSCPLYVIDGVRVVETHGISRMHRLIGWLVPILVILLFLGFDIDIARDRTAGWIGTLILWIVLLVEAGLLWGWNNLWD